MKKTINIKVGKISDKTMTWKKAKAYAEEQGMRLPTRTESLAMIEAGVEGLPSWWWTCEEYGASYAWLVRDDGYVHANNKCYGYSAVPVAALDKSSELDTCELSADEQENAGGTEMNKQIKIYGAEWRIIYADSISVERENTFKFGISDSINKVITIATKNPQGDKLPFREIELTTLHEIIHAICDEGQYKDYSADDPFVEWMARCLLDLKEQNEELK